MAEKTALLVMSDHGRAQPTLAHHGGFSTSELAVQWLLSAPGVRAGHRIRWPVSIMDSAPTLLHTLGISPPVQFYGRVVADAFVGARAGWDAPSTTSERATPRDATSSLTERAPSAVRTPSVARDPSIAHNPNAMRDTAWLAPMFLGALLGISATLVCTYFGAAASPCVPHGARHTSSRPHSFLSGTHPAADRLRAAAGEPEHEIQGLLR